MRISDYITTGTSKRDKKSKKAIITIGLTITSILLAVIVIVTFYGQFTGTYFIQISRDTQNKGIVISETADFANASSKLAMKPVEFANEYTEDHVLLNRDAALNTDGQYYSETTPEILAYTFYLKNYGAEIIDVNYFINVTQSINDLADAIMIKIYEVDLETNILIEHESVGKSPSSNFILTTQIKNFKPNNIRKLTMFVWLEGERTKPEMLGGRAKLSFVLTIANAEGGEIWEK